jgi:general secretion pathway protein G
MVTLLAPSACKTTRFWINNPWRRQVAFTLIELLVTLTIIALLLSIVAPRYFSSVSRAQETTLKQNLSVLRDAIDKYYGDNGKYPSAIEDLVQKKYIRSVPVDPITESSTTWVLVAPDDPAKGKVFDVHSGAAGTAKDGTPYSQL